MLFRNASEIQNDRVFIFYLGGPAPSGRRRAIRFTSLRSVLAPIPAFLPPRTEYPKIDINKIQF